MASFLFINHSVIARRGVAPTWQSPGTMFVSALQIDEWYQEIPTVALLPRNDIVGTCCKKSLHV